MTQNVGSHWDAADRALNSNPDISVSSKSIDRVCGRSEAHAVSTLSSLLIFGVICLYPKHWTRINTLNTRNQHNTEQNGIIVQMRCAGSKEGSKTLDAQS